MAKVYVTCPIASVERARRVADDLTKLGHVVVSSWHRDGGIAPESGGEEIFAALLERADVCDREIRSADVIVALTDDHVGTETYVEIGMAQGEMIPIVWSTERGGDAKLAIRRRGVVPVKADALAASAIDLALGKRGRSLTQIRIAFESAEGTS